MKKLAVILLLSVFAFSLISGAVSAQDSIVVGVDAPPEPWTPMVLMLILIYPL